MREQGTIVDCVYCKYIKPHLLKSKDCPQCHGNTPYFKPMRMMDQETSREAILIDILNMEINDDYSEMEKSLLSLLSKIEIYEFDLKSALIHYIQKNG